MESAVRIVARDQRDRVGEGPLWVARESALYWVDILGQRLNRLMLDDNSISSWAMPEPIGWIIERAGKPGFIAGFQSGFAFLELDPVRIRRIASPEPHRPSNRLNDAKADDDGAIWAGTMPMDGDGAEGAFYRLDPSGVIDCVDTGYRIPNGPAISLDGRWLYHADSALSTVYRYAIADGKLTGREVFLRFDADWGLPDGMTVDAEGGLWIAHWGGGCVSRFAPDGVRDRRIALPASQITSCTFGGVGLDRMFVTSAALGKEDALEGALFEVDPGCRGIPARKFAG
jgi:Gluconolactonase